MNHNLPMITYNIQVWTKSFGCHHRPTSIRFWTCIVQKRKSCLFIPQLISLRNNTSLHVISTARCENIIPMFVLISIIRYDSYSFIPYKLDGTIYHLITFLDLAILFSSQLKKCFFVSIMTNHKLVIRNYLKNFLSLNSI